MSTATATPVTQSDLNARNAALFRQLQPHRETDVMQRITLFVVNKTGKKLADYINDATVPFEDRIALVDELTEIAKGLDWGKLPVIPKGQAATTPAAATPAPRPAAPRVLEPAAPRPAAPKPVAPTPAPEVLVDFPPAAIETHAIPVGPNPGATVLDEANDEDESESSDPMSIITAQLRKLAAQPKAKGITEADVRRIVRQELATVLTSIADVLKK